MKRFALIIVLPLLLLGCDAPPDTIAGRVQAGVEKACQFRADQAWLEEVVMKMGATVQMVDHLVGMVCDGVLSARNTQMMQGLTSAKCPYGEIVVFGETICIEGEPIDPEEKQ